KHNSADTTNAANISEQAMFFHDVTVGELRVLLRKLPSQNSTALDEVPSSVIKS
ncbi:hypothetical protein HHI36_017805, partial [Cryptolaemus montrouzieri]